MLICNNSSFNWDVTLTSWESTLTLSEPQSLEVFSPICLPEGTVPPAFFEVGTFLEEYVSKYLTIHKNVKTLTLNLVKFV